MSENIIYDVVECEVTQTKKISKVETELKDKIDSEKVNLSKDFNNKLETLKSKFDQEKKELLESLQVEFKKKDSDLSKKIKKYDDASQKIDNFVDKIVKEMSNNGN